MSDLFSVCPSCSEQNVAITKLECGSCDTKFEGAFNLPQLSKLTKGEQDFVLNFVKCSGSLKEMGKLQNVSYPTLRNNLNSLIEKINGLIEPKEDLKNKILSQLENGTISAKEAAQKLKEL